VAIGRYERATALLEQPPPSALSSGAAPLLAFAEFLVARQAGDMSGLENASTALIQQDPLGPFGTFALYEMGSVCLWQGADLAESTCGRRSSKRRPSRCMPSRFAAWVG
jgi:hypothetical protein